MSTPLIIAAHGTRDADGEQTCRRFVERVARALPDVKVGLGFVELNQPGIPQALTDIVDGEETRRAVVVPLMLGTGAHVRRDIPGFIAEALEEVPGARIDYAPHLGADPRLVDAVNQRIDAAMGDWRRDETCLVFVGRGAVVADANADHVRLARMHYEAGGWADVQECFIQVTRPSLPEGLDRAYAAGHRQLVVMGHWIFPGRLRSWTFQQAEAWAAAHPDARVRVAEVIGDCDELAAVVIDRYREAMPEAAAEGSPAYVAGLLLTGRRVVVVGGGVVSTRRVPKLIAAGARVTLVSPTATGALQALAAAGDVAWERREFAEGDLEGAWYVLADTDDPGVNARVVAEAERRHTFCVRADDAVQGTAYTAASRGVGHLTVAVVGDRNPRRSRHVLEAIVGSEDVRQAIAEPFRRN
ncbi:CbiX/SirB N-terminal domain-containing protein [Tessaracoccus lacteus]|uniref:CbiX/SirB N-terminal domain-containing protein n=1 Tax=Tessaracoccus lacteus TaxID=3041766 RepID=A0ABY8PUQ1_9ACTN|nr:CbiX/SirB N-terminal domain-containing protein [Tessaracoccus sp. T21]WGT46171.1 CbiX/SirB N-terminal domain-containing protein [Tessaracoccus sp. T21]